MNPNLISIILLALLIFQEIQHYIVIQKLVNKIMAGNYQAYLAAQTIGKPHMVKDRLDNESVPEDLGVLQQIVS